MSSTGFFGMKVHQGLSFSWPMMKINKSTSVFWPGCALMKLDPEILHKTLEILRKEEAHMGISTCCCAQPSEYLFPEKFQKIQEKLVRLIESQEIKRIYTACPNCMVQLGKLDIEIIPIWGILTKHMPAENVSQLEEIFVIHDPCPMRHEQVQQEAIRSLLQKKKANFIEPLHRGKHTICCGNKHMIRATHPKKSEKIRLHRLKEFSENATILSYCEGCLDAFASEGRKTRHILEILFGKSKTKSWANRFKYTFTAK